MGGGDPNRFQIFVICRREFYLDIILHAIINVIYFGYGNHIDNTIDIIGDEAEVIREGVVAEADTEASAFHHRDPQWSFDVELGSIGELFNMTEERAIIQIQESYGLAGVAVQVLVGFLPFVRFLNDKLELDLRIGVEINDRAIGKCDFDRALRAGADNIALLDDVTYFQRRCRGDVRALMDGDRAAKIKNLCIGKGRRLNCLSEQCEDP